MCTRPCKRTRRQVTGSDVRYESSFGPPAKRRVGQPPRDSLASRRSLVANRLSELRRERYSELSSTHAGKLPRYDARIKLGAQSTLPVAVLRQSATDRA